MKNSFPLPSQSPQGGRCVTQSAPTLEFTAANKETFSVTALENDIVRVAFYPNGAPRFERTWLVLGKDGAMPKEGRLRSDFSGFSLPTVKIAASEKQVSLQTADLREGRPVLVNLFASWCVPCAIESPQLEALRRKGAPLLGIAMVVGETVGMIVTDPRLQARHAYARRLKAQQAAADLQA